MKQASAREPFKTAGEPEAPCRESDAGIFHISEVLTLLTRRGVTSRTRTRPDGQTESFGNSRFVLARLMEFLTGVNMTNPGLETSPVLVRTSNDSQPSLSVVNPDSVSPTPEYLYDGQAMLDHANQAKTALRNQPGMEWLATIEFPKQEYAAVPQTFEDLNAFCQKWIEQMAAQHGAWHVLVSPANLARKPDSAGPSRNLH